MARIKYYDHETGKWKYADKSITGSGTGSGGTGEDGFSPIAKVEQTATGAVISITDKDGTTTATITNGKDGASFDSNIPDYVKTEALRVCNQVLSHDVGRCVRILCCSDAHQDSTDSQIDESNRHAGQAMKIITDTIGIDLCASLGDMAWGDTETLETAREEHSIIAGYIAEAFRGKKALCTQGNHDAMWYGYNTNGAVLSQSEMYGRISGNSNLDWIDGKHGYGYIDYADRGVRVIMLNTADTIGMTAKQGGQAVISEVQAKWFCETLLEVGQKEGWHVIVVSHHPAEWSNAYQVANIMSAYRYGEAYTIGSESYNFASKNMARILCQIHGHIHNYLVDYVRKVNITSSTSEATDIKRIAIPNMCFERNNEYGQNGVTDTWDIDYGEETTYNKTAQSANDTTFCVLTVDLDNNIIYADRYGAGYDRVIDVAPPASFENIIDTVGYTDGVRLSTSSGSTSNLDGFTTTGYIPVTVGSHTIRFKGCEMATSGYTTGYAGATYDGSKAKVATWGSEFNDNTSYDATNDVYVFIVDIPDEVAFMRFSGKGSGANLICTIDAEIV